MKIRKLLIYIAAAAVSLALATAAFAEDGELPDAPPAASEETQQSEETSEPTVETDPDPDETTTEPDETGPEETTEPEETTTESEETTTPAPDISLGTDPPQTTTTTTTPAAVVTTTTPATQPTVETTPEATAEVTEETTTEETTTEATTPVLSDNGDDQPPTTFPNEDYNPMPGDPDDMNSVLLILGIATAVFVLILVSPTIIRKIKNSIIYKYD